jgi:hypothetical protein
MQDVVNSFRLVLLTTPIVECLLTLEQDWGLEL